jgi:MFS transporter, putative metabolite:H+ symporter
MRALETRVAAEYKRPLPSSPALESITRHDQMRQMWTPPYLSRSLMMIIFNIFQTASFYGFLNWVPTLLIKQGITITNSLFYTSLIALAAPIGPLLGLLIADRFERKHVLVAVSLVIIACGLAFSQARGAASIVVLGACLTLGNNMMSFTFHTYQQELFPTAIRARAVGFVYSWSRFSAISTGFVIAFILQRSSVAGVFVFISSAMLVSLLAVALMGPRTRNLALEQISN